MDKKLANKMVYRFKLLISSKLEDLRLKHYLAAGAVSVGFALAAFLECLA